MQNNENTSDAEIAPGEKDQALEDQAPKADSDPSPPHVAPSTAAATENVETESQDKRYAPVADTATGEKDQPSKLDSAAPSPEKPERDHTWVFDYAGSKISVLGRGVGSDGYEEFVDSEGGAKLICSWSIGRSDEPVMWVPGKPSPSESTQLRFLTISRRCATLERLGAARGIPGRDVLVCG